MKFILSIFFSSLLGCLIALLFNNTTLYVMHADYPLIYIILCPLGTYLLIFFTKNITSLIFKYLTKDNTIAKLLNAAIMIYFMFLSITLPWKMDIEYYSEQIVIAIVMSSMIAITFIAMTILPFTFNKE